MRQVPRLRRMVRVLVFLYVAGSGLATGTAFAAGTAFSFGSNSNARSGQGTNTGLTLVATPIDATHLEGVSITQVAGNLAHSVILSDTGITYSFGRNSEGVTGLGLTSGDTLVATPVLTTNLGERTIAQVAADQWQSLFLAADGIVFASGWNNHGSTGQGTRIGNVTVPSEIHPGALMGRPVTQVSAGGLHSLLLADDGTAFSFGSNWEGQTGIGVISSWTTSATPIHTTNLGNRLITEVSAGGAHSLVLADDGSVFAFGLNADGRTGLGTTSGATGVATAIDTSNLGGRAIVQVAAGPAHSLILADDGTVFAFGANDNGRTGRNLTSGDTLIATPIDTSNLGGRTIVQIAVGGNHSLLRADDGTVFAFGANGSGQTGMNTTVGDTLVATPIDTSNLAGYRVTDLSAGSGYSLLVATLGIPCGQSLFPICDGECPVDQQCIEGPENGCQCVACDDVPGDGVTLQFTSATRLTWNWAPCASWHNVYRATLVRLEDGGDGLAIDYGECFSPGLAGAALDDHTDPPSGEMHIYLVTGGNAFGEGGLGHTSDGQERPLLAPCP